MKIHSLVLALVLTLQIFAHFTASAAPANDFFANRQQLTGVPINISVNETDLAAAEDFCYDSNNSLWYEWTAPAEGWYLISLPRDTNALFTNISFFEGGENDPNNLVFLEKIQAIVSRNLKLYAQSGESFIFKLSGFANIFLGTSEANFTIDSYEGTEIWLEESSISQEVVDVGSGDAVLNLQYRVVSPNSTFNSSRIWVDFLDDECRQNSPYFPVSSCQILTNIDWYEEENWQLISGTASDGIYQSEVVFPQYLIPGIYKLSIETYVVDSMGNTHSLSIAPTEGPVGLFQTISPASRYLYVEVQNSGIVDTEPPTIGNVQIIPSVVDYADGLEKTVTVQFDYFDEHRGIDYDAIMAGSNYAGFSFILQHRDIENRYVFYESTRDLEIISGDKNSGTIRAELTLRSQQTYEILNGDYDLEIYANDLNGNSRTYTNAAPRGDCQVQFSPADKILTITGATAVDPCPLKISDFSFDVATGAVSFDFAPLEQYSSYDIESSTDLQSWSYRTSIYADSDQASANYSASFVAPPSGRIFYRVRKN